MILSAADSSKSLQVWEGLNFNLRLEKQLGKVLVNQLDKADFDFDRRPEFAVMGYAGQSGLSPSLLWVGNYNFPYVWTYQMGEHYWGGLPVWRCSI